MEFACVKAALGCRPHRPKNKLNPHWAPLNPEGKGGFRELMPFSPNSSSDCNYLQIKYDFNLKSWTIFMQFNFSLHFRSFSCLTLGWPSNALGPSHRTDNKPFFVIFNHRDTRIYFSHIGSDFFLIHTAQIKQKKLIFSCVYPPVKVKPGFLISIK